MQPQLRRRRSLVNEAFSYARAKAHKPVKVTLPSPLMLFMFWSPEQSRAVYRDPFELFADGAEVIRDEGRELARLGCGHVQIDAPELATLTDPTATQAIYEKNGIDSRRLLTDGLAILNTLADVPGGRVSGWRARLAESADAAGFTVGVLAAQLAGPRVPPQVGAGIHAASAARSATTS